MTTYEIHSYMSLGRMTDVWKSIFISLQDKFFKKAYWIQEQIKIRQFICTLTVKCIDCAIHTIEYYIIIKIHELWLHSSG